MRVTFTARKLAAWRQAWPCSTLVVGTAYFDNGGDLVDLSGPLARAEVDGREFDAFVDDYQPAALRAIRGARCA